MGTGEDQEALTSHLLLWSGAQARKHILPQFFSQKLCMPISSVKKVPIYLGEETTRAIEIVYLQIFLKISNSVAGGTLGALLEKPFTDSCTIATGWGEDHLNFQ